MCFLTGESEGFCLTDVELDLSVGSISTFEFLIINDSNIDVPNSHWLVDENKGAKGLSLTNKRQMMVDGISNRPLHFYQKGIIGFQVFLCSDPKEWVG